VSLPSSLSTADSSLVSAPVAASPTDMSSHQAALKSSRKLVNLGIIYGCAAYTIWGLIPLFFKLLAGIAPLDVLAQRIVWSVPLLWLLVLGLGKGKQLLTAFRSWKTVRNLVICAVLLSTNWYIFLYATFNNQIMQSSLAYFMLPLFNVLLGMLFLRERLLPFQMFCVLLAGTGVAIMAIAGGVFPWLAVSLAVTFGLYGLVHKLTPVDSVVALTIEMMSILPVSLCYLLMYSPTMTADYWKANPGMIGLIMFSGVVTSVPLLLFINATKLVRFITLGMMQYIAPTIQFLLAWQLYHEPFQWEKQIAFSFIWVSLIIFMIGSYMATSKAAKVAPISAS
jgi:chloramphenicol-sensitive protein RarD